MCASNDGMLMARALPADLLDYRKWEVLTELRGDAKSGVLSPVFSTDMSTKWDSAVNVFSHPLMTGENGIVTFNAVLKRYFLPNFSFLHPNRSTPLAWHGYEPPATKCSAYRHRSQVRCSPLRSPPRSPSCSSPC